MQLNALFVVLLRLCMGCQDIRQDRQPDSPNAAISIYDSKKHYKRHRKNDHVDRSYCQILPISAR